MKTKELSFYTFFLIFRDWRQEGSFCHNCTPCTCPWFHILTDHYFLELLDTISRRLFQIYGFSVGFSDKSKPDYQGRTRYYCRMFYTYNHSQRKLMIDLWIYRDFYSIIRLINEFNLVLNRFKWLVKLTYLLLKEVLEI